MKVLISAYACEPGTGSEGGVGWHVVGELSKRHDLVVITRANNREKILASPEEWVRRVEWVFHDPPRWQVFWKRGPRGVQLFYLIWQWGLAALARDLMARHRFDVAHHLTFGKYWVPSRLGGIGLPFVFGPVGGGESTPPPLRSVYGWRGRLAERARDAIRGLLSFPGPMRAALRRASWTLAATQQTADVLREAGVNRLSVQAQSGITRHELEALADAPFSGKKNGPVRLVTACRLIHWKAVDLAIEAVAAARSRGLDARLTVLQDGPERPSLERLAVNLGIGDAVTFAGRLPTLGDVYRTIRESDALIHPALHEAFGQACLEALALGTPVICLDWAGPGVIVTGECGYKIVPGSKKETVERFADAIMNLNADRGNAGRRSRAARSRAGDFLWDSICAGIEEAYRKAADPSHSPADSPTRS
jgi:glycosyltransferase involved in cell wall biosynthesis